MSQNTSLNEIGINFSKYLQSDNVSSGQAETNIRKYISAKDNNKELFIKFDMADKQGNLISYDGDLRIILRNSDIRGWKYDKRLRSQMVDTVYVVLVKEIDEESKCIYVDHKAVKDVDKEKLIEILKSTPGVRVPAKIVVVRQHVAIVDIGGLGIPGFIPIAEWSQCFSMDIRKSASVGDVLTVAVMGKEDFLQKKDKTFRQLGKWLEEDFYLCSRKATMKDPWEGISDKVHKNDIVVVTCVSKAQKAFFGTMKDIPELNVYCFYPNDINMEIIEGAQYKCIVRKVSEEKRILRVEPFSKVS